MSDDIYAYNYAYKAMIALAHATSHIIWLHSCLTQSIGQLMQHWHCHVELNACPFIIRHCRRWTNHGPDNPHEQFDDDQWRAYLAVHSTVRCVKDVQCNHQPRQLQVHILTVSLETHFNHKYGNHVIQKALRHHASFDHIHVCRNPLDN